MTNSTLPTLTPAETTFEHIAKTIIKLEESDIKILEKNRCKNMYGLAQMSPQDNPDLTFECIVTKVIMKVIGYIQYHKYKVDHAIWIIF